MTLDEALEQLAKAKTKNRELKRELTVKEKTIEELKIHNTFLTDRLELSHERLHQERDKRLKMTMDDVVVMHKAQAEYQAKYLKDQEVIETVEKHEKDVEKLKGGLDGVKQDT